MPTAVQPFRRSLGTILLALLLAGGVAATLWLGRTLAAAVDEPAPLGADAPTPAARVPLH
jgi:hypothetical protein